MNNIAPERRSQCMNDLARVAKCRAVETDALGDCRACGKGRHDAESHQRQEGGEEPKRSTVHHQLATRASVRGDLSIGSYFHSDGLDPLHSTSTSLPEGFLSA